MMASTSYKRDSRRVFVGNLHPDTGRRDVERIFAKYGQIVDIHLVKDKEKGIDRLPYAFVEFGRSREAKVAAEKREGYSFTGRLLRVELSRPKGEEKENKNRDNGTGGGQKKDEGNRTRHRVVASGLPLSVSWQDLKDHMRRAGEVAYSNVYGDGIGVVEYLTKQDMEYAVLELDMSTIRSHQGEVGKISVQVEVPEEGRTRSRSGSRSSSMSRRPHRDSKQSPVEGPSQGNASIYSPIRSESPSPDHAPSESWSLSPNRPSSRSSNRPPRRCLNQSPSRSPSYSPRPPGSWSPSSSPRRTPNGARDGSRSRSGSPAGQFEYYYYSPSGYATPKDYSPHTPPTPPKVYVCKCEKCVKRRELESLELEKLEATRFQLAKQLFPAKVE